MNMLMAWSRWSRPFEMRDHSSAAMTRGITSKGQDRSMLPASEYTVNEMPMEAIAFSAASCRWNSASPSSVR